MFMFTFFSGYHPLSHCRGMSSAEFNAVLKQLSSLHAAGSAYLAKHGVKMAPEGSFINELINPLLMTFILLALRTSCPAPKGEECEDYGPLPMFK